MPGRSKKLTPEDEKKIVSATKAGVPIAILAKQYGVTRPTIYRAIRRFFDKASSAQVATAPVSFTINRDELRAFDAFIGRLGLDSRADGIVRLFLFGGALGLCRSLWAEPFSHARPKAERVSPGMPV